MATSNSALASKSAVSFARTATKASDRCRASVQTHCGNAPSKSSLHLTRGTGRRGSSLRMFTSTSTSVETTSLSDEELEEIMEYQELDSDGSLLASSSFPIKPDELIVLAKKFCATEFGCKRPSMLAEDFTATLPFVGPLGKEQFMGIFGAFDIKSAFPDFKQNFYGWTVDPAQPDRVWVMSRSRGTNTAPFVGGIEPTNKEVEVVPTMSSVRFNEEGQAVHFTTGYALDKDVGNTGGLSAAFGLIYALKPDLLWMIPEAQPWKPSFALKFLGRLGAVGKILQLRLKKNEKVGFNDENVGPREQ